MCIRDRAYVSRYLGRHPRGAELKTNYYKPSKNPIFVLRPLLGKQVKLSSPLFGVICTAVRCLGSHVGQSAVWGHKLSSSLFGVKSNAIRCLGSPLFGTQARARARTRQSASD